MKKNIIPEKFQKEYNQELSHLFYFRINLFCYIAIFAFVLELLLALIFFRGILGAKDIPGIAGGIGFSILLLITAKFSNSLYLHKTRAALFSLLLILISILAATAHPVIISYMGITLVLVAFFSTVLLLPWSWIEALLLGLFTVVNFIWIYRVSDTYVSNEIFGINVVLLLLTSFIGIIVKNSEDILRKKNFFSRKTLEDKNSLMAKELDLANKIHKSLMPKSFTNEKVDIAVSYKPVLYMGGDYAKFFFKDQDKLLVVLADVTGHGVSSALLVNRVHAELERLVHEELDPGKILRALDTFINRDFGKMGYFLSAFCGLLDFSKSKLIYSNYGHPPQILVQSKTNKLLLMESQTFMMGIGMDTESLYSNEASFQKGDRLVLFTDGIIEAKSEDGELFEQERLQEFVKNNITVDVLEFNKKLLKEIDRFQHNDQADDIFILTIQTK